MKLGTNPVTDVWKQRRLFITNEIFVPNKLDEVFRKKKKMPAPKGQREWHLNTAVHVCQRRPGQNRDISIMSLDAPLPRISGEFEWSRPPADPQVRADSSWWVR